MSQQLSTVYLTIGYQYTTDSTITVQQNAAHQTELRFRVAGNWLVIPSNLLERTEAICCPAPLPQQVTDRQHREVEMCMTCGKVLIVLLDTPTFTKRLNEPDDKRSGIAGLEDRPAKTRPEGVICPECSEHTCPADVRVGRFTCPQCGTKLIDKPYEGGWQVIHEEKAIPTPTRKPRNTISVHAHWSLTLTTGDTIVVCGVCNHEASRSKVSGRLNGQPEHTVTLFAFTRTNNCKLCDQPYEENEVCPKNHHGHPPFHQRKYIGRSVKVPACSSCAGHARYEVDADIIDDITSAIASGKPPLAVERWRRSLRDANMLIE